MIKNANKSISQNAIAVGTPTQVTKYREGKKKPKEVETN